MREEQLLYMLDLRARAYEREVVRLRSNRQPIFEIGQVESLARDFKDAKETVELLIARSNENRMIRSERDRALEQVGALKAKLAELTGRVDK